MATEAKIHSSSGTFKMKLQCIDSLKYIKKKKKLKQEEQTLRYGHTDFVRWMKTWAEEGVNETFFILHTKNA